MPVSPERAKTLRRLLAETKPSAVAPDAPRVVIDTNVLMDLLHWEDPHAEDLRELIETEKLTPVRDEATLLELAEVLDRTTFAIGFERVTEMLARWVRASVDVKDAALQAALSPTGVPRCRDPLDQKFLDLARGSGAAILVTKDKLVLKTHRKMAAFGCTVVKPEDVRAAWEALG